MSKMMMMMMKKSERESRCTVFIFCGAEGEGETWSRRYICIADWKQLGVQ